LFCFPYSGGGASLFRMWPDRLPQAVEVCAVQFPGRENRLAEAPFTRVPEVVQTLAVALSPYLTVPFALFGHSLGAFVAFELARELRAQNAPQPVHLFVSGQRAPQLPDRFPPVSDLPDEEFIQEIRRRYDAIPPAVVECTDLMQMLLPLLRADFSMVDRYAFVEGIPLDRPITCLGGHDDPETPKEDLEAWHHQTLRSFALKTFPGGHFFIRDAQAAVLRAISEDLERALSDDAPCHHGG
jgi:medium-chain acyl-[acyl-carrier-protein] hydrolase